MRVPGINAPGQKKLLGITRYDIPGEISDSLPGTKECPEVD